jgi:hypothetical protein
LSVDSPMDTNCAPFPADYSFFISMKRTTVKRVTPVVEAITVSLKIFCSYLMIPFLFDAPETESIYMIRNAHFVHLDILESIQVHWRFFLRIQIGIPIVDIATLFWVETRLTL